MHTSFQVFKSYITHPITFRLFLLQKLPAVFFAGLRIASLTQQQAVVSVNKKWFNKNPFGSIYFAILSMAAEVSTGVLCMGALYKRKPTVSMLVTKSEGHFHKKAVGKILFTCNDGEAISMAVEETIANNTPTTITCHSVGKNEGGELVAEFYFTWSFKVKNA
ncbi:MAG TPA: DUF4442 domain-containing protein [Chitinophagaceae bacterium]|nr:DUF4442 domain-containing protein [Chitinophagaceae bacterium]